MLWREAAPCYTRSEVLCGDGDLFWNGYSTQLPRPKNLQLDEPRFNSEKRRRVCEWSRVVTSPQRSLSNLTLQRHYCCQSATTSLITSIVRYNPLHSLCTVRFTHWLLCRISSIRTHAYTIVLPLAIYSRYGTAFTAVLSTMYGEHKWPKTTMQSY